MTANHQNVRAWGYALGVVAAVEIAVVFAVPVRAPIDDGARFYLAGRKPNFTESVVQWQIARVRALAVPADVLVLGDSSALTSVAPEEIARSLPGIVVENAGTIAPLWIEGHVLVLEEYLAHHPAPAVVIYQFADWSLSADRDQIERIGMLPVLRDWLGKSESFTRWWPTVRLRTRARAAIGGHAFDAWPDDATVHDYLYAHHGFLPDLLPARADWSDVELPDVAIHADALAGIERLVLVTRDAGSRLLLVHGPVPDVADTPEARAAYAGNLRFLEAIAATYPHVVVVSPIPRFVPRAFCTTTAHVTLEGALLHSRALAALLAPYFTPR